MSKVVQSFKLVTPCPTPPPPTPAMMNWDKTRVHRPQGNAQVDFEIDLEQPSSSTSLREDAITLLAFLPIM